MPLTTQDSNDYVLLSIESNKGGVGKTTAALNLASILLEKGHPVLLLDVDFTGTDIAEIEQSPFWKDRINILTNSNKPINLIEVYSEIFLKANDFLTRSDFEKILNIDKINIIGSNIYNNKQQEQQIVSPAILYDILHNEWFIRFFETISSRFISHIKSSNVKKPVIIFDNSPGYIGLVPIIHEWFLRIGPKKCKILHIGSFDKQDLVAVYCNYLNINKKFNSKIENFCLIRNLINNSFDNFPLNDSDLLPLLIDEVDIKKIDEIIREYEENKVFFQSVIINKIPPEVIQEENQLTKILKSSFKDLKKDTLELPIFLTKKKSQNQIEMDLFVTFDNNINMNFFPEDFFKINLISSFKKSDFKLFFEETIIILTKRLQKQKDNFLDIFENNLYKSSIYRNVSFLDSILQNLFNYFKTFNMPFYINSFNTFWKIDTVLNNLVSFIKINNFLFYDTKVNVKFHAHDNIEEIFKQNITDFDIISTFLTYIFIFSFTTDTPNINLLESELVIAIFKSFIGYQSSQLTTYNLSISDFFKHENKVGLLPFFNKFISKYKKINQNETDFIKHLYKKISYIQARLIDQNKDVLFILKAYQENLRYIDIIESNHNQIFKNPYFIDCINEVVVEKNIPHDQGMIRLKELKYMFAFKKPLEKVLKNWEI